MNRVRLKLCLPLLVVSLLVAGCKSNATGSAGSTGAAAAAAATSVVASAATPAATPAAISPTEAACPTSNTTAFAKTKFVTHVGLLVGTFHRYLYKPLRAGSFGSGVHGRLAALIKAGSTALFDVHEARLAVADVKGNPLLCKALAAPLTGIATKLDAIRTKIVHGDTSGLADANSSLSAITSASAQDGVPITESTDESQG